MDSTKVVRPVNWSTLFTSNRKVVKEFANGTLSFEKFKSAYKGDARKEVLVLERNHTAKESRILARRAVKRRTTTVSTKARLVTSK